MKNLEKLEVGDYVIVVRGHNIEYISKVTRITKTLILVGENEERYKKSTGSLQGKSKWDINYIEPATQERVDKIREKQYRAKLLYVLDSFRYKMLPVEELENIYAIIRKYRK